MARFETKELNDYDVMQHIKNIYGIIGTTGKESVQTVESDNIVERLKELDKNKVVDWVGTKEEYEIAKADILSAVEIKEKQPPVHNPILLKI